MCGTPLPRRPALPLPPPLHQPAKSAPASRATTPAPDDVDSDDDDEDGSDSPEKRMIRLSFRKGGDKPFYAVLRRSLLGKGWEVRLILIGFKLPPHI